MTENIFSQYDDDEDSLVITPPQDAGTNPFSSFDDDPVEPDPAKQTVSPSVPQQDDWYKPLADRKSQETARESSRVLTEAERKSFGFEQPQTEEDASFWGSLEHGLGNRNIEAYADTLDHLADMSDDPSYSQSYRDWSGSLRRTVQEDGSTYKPVFQSYKQINGLADAWGYVKEVAGEQIGIQLPGIVGAIGGGYLGQKVGAPLGKVGRAAGGFSGATAGALSGMIHHHVSEMRNALKREKIEGADLVKYTNYGTMVLAGLDLAFPVVAGLKFNGPVRQAISRKIALQLAKGGTLRAPSEFIKRFGKEIVKDAILLEVPTEIAQEAVTTFVPPEVAGREVTDEEIQRFVTETVPETALRTAIGAGGITAPGSALQARRDVQAGREIAADRDFAAEAKAAEQSQQVARETKEDQIEVQQPVEEAQEAQARPETGVVEPDGTQVDSQKTGTSVAPRQPEAQAETLEEDAFTAEELTSTLGGVLRQEVNLRTRPENGNTKILIGDKVIGTVPGQATQESAIQLIGQRLRTAMQSEQRRFAADPEQMGLDEFTIAYALRDMFPEFEVSSEDFGNVIQTDPQTGTFRVDIRQLYDKFRQQMDGQPVAAQAGLSTDLQSYEQEAILPAIEEIDAEVGLPILADAYGKLTPDEKSEIISRVSENEEDIADLIEEIAIRNEDAPTIAAMAIRRGLNDEQIAQVRQLIAEQSPELAAGFDELIASLPKRGRTTASRPARQTAQIRRQFAAVLNSRTPRAKWASELGIDESAIEPLIEEAIRKGFLRRDKNGNVRRVPKSQRSGSFAAMAIPENLPDTLPGEGDVALTPEAEEGWPEVKAAINRAASAILPDAVKVDVVDNIAIATLKKEDQMLALREEAAFRRWFGDSKVVDENGEPLVVYHGSPEATFDAVDFTFALGHQSRPSEEPSNAYYFSNSYNSAIDYADGVREQVASVYLKMENPLDLRERSVQEKLFIALDPENKYGINRNDGGDFNRVDDFYDEDGNKINPLPQIESASTFWDWAMQVSDGNANVFVNDIADWAKDSGYDGLIFLDGNRGDISTSYAVFGPTQIKSIFNRGTFDPTDPRISYALRKTKPSESAIDEDASENRVDTGREGVETVEGQPAPGGTTVEGESLQAPASDDLGAGIPDRALARIIRQESASLDADGNIIAGRPSRQAKTSRKGREGQPIQRAGKVESFDIEGFDGRVKAETLTDRDQREGNLARLTYEVREPGSKSAIPLGEMEITQRSDGAWEVGYVEIRAPRNGIGTKLYDAVEKDLGVRMSPSGVLSESGHAFWQKRSPASVQWHVKTPTFTDEAGKMYFSPRKITDEMDRIGRELKNLSAGSGRAMRIPAAERKELRKALVKERGKLIALYGKLPLEARAAKDQMFALRAFHGSPHDFDRFDLSRIGTGEGAQAFGSGLYFAENELTAKAYQEQLSNLPVLDDSSGSIFSGLPWTSRTTEKHARYAMDQAIQSGLDGDNAVRRAIEILTDEGNRASASHVRQPYYDAANALGGMLGKKWEINPGQLYEVEIDVEPEQLLDYDIDLNDQPAMLEALKPLAKQMWPDLREFQLNNRLRFRDGRSFYDDLIGFTGTPQRASDALREAGIPGMRYLDQGSRDVDDGTRNIVLFDDSLVTITKKNGKPVSAEERQGVIDEMFALRGFYSPAIRAAENISQPQALGQTDPYAMSISIAMRAVEAEARSKGVAPEQEAVRVLRHEAVEFFKATGLFTEKEWNVLKSAAKRNGWVETTGVRESYESVYKGGMTETEMNDLLIKEAIAEQYSEFHLGKKQFKGVVAEVFQRIKDFIDRTANFMRGEGFQTWEDVFERIDEGEFKQRFNEKFPELAPQQEVEAVAPMTLPGVRPEAPLAPPPPGPTPGLQTSAAGSLIDIQRNLRKKLGLTVKRGRLDEELKRISALAGTKLQGQYSRQTGVIRLAVLESIDNEAHEVAHALEDRYPLGRLKSAHENTLVGIAEMSGNTTASEGFAEFFRLYLTNPQAAETHAPQFLKDFEAQMQAIDPETLADIQEIRSQYMDWRNASSAGRIIASTKSGVPEGTWAAIRKEYNEGGMAAIGGMYWRYLERVYKGRIDKTNSIRKLTMRIVRQAEKNNQDVDLSVWRNPQMQAQKIGSADAMGTIDIMKGVHWENSAGKGTVSLKDALSRAFNGNGYEEWSDAQRDAFGAYLIGRRGRWLWQRFDMDPARNRGRLANAPEFATDGDWYYDTMKRQRRVMLNGRWETELLHAPDKHNSSDHVQTVADLEAANPQFAEAAEMVYQFLRDLVLKRYQAGLDTLEEYQYKINTPDYVPWFRDMSDEIFKGTAVSGRTVAQKFKLRGSYRDFINPVEGIVRQVYDTNHEIAVNKPKLLLAQMAEAVTGAGQYAEVIPATRMKVQEVKIQDALMNAARQEGLPPEDAKQMISAVAAMVGDDAVAKLFSQEQAREGRDAIVHYMDGGQLKMLQIHDDGYGIARDILGFFETVRGTPFGDSFFNMLVGAVRVPQRGITAHPGFLWRNLIRDTYNAAVMQAGYFPIVSNIRTVASNIARRNRGEETWSDIIARHGGIMGGLNRTNIQQLRQGRTSELRTDGVTLRPWRRDFWTRTMNPFNEDFWKWAEWSEANARQTLARIAFNRALKDAQHRYPDMPPEQQTFVALESAVQQSRDYTDYGRSGDFASQIVMNRLIMFLNPALQGPDKMIRKLFLAQTPDGRFAAAQAVRKQLAPLFNRETPTKPLTKTEKDALKDALRAWVTVAIIAHTHLLIELLFNDDDELEDKSEMERALNVPMTINGQPYRIPRGFDVVNVASNAVRATYDSWKKEDPTAWRRFRETLGYSLVPPHSSPLLDMYIGWKHGRNNFFDSAIEPEYMKGLLPGDRYRAYTSKLSRDIAEGINSIAPTEVSPLMVEYTLNTIGSDWARDILRTYDAVDPDKPALRWQEYPFIRTTRGLRGTRGSEDFWNLMGREGEFMQPAGSYKQEAVDDKVWSKEEIRKFFEQRVADDDAKAFSVLNGHYDIKQRRLHPMQRAREFITGLSATARAVASNRIDDPRTEKRVEVSRAVRGQANEIIAEITRREYLNALIALQRPGYEFREPQPVQPYMDELKTISPEIYKVLIDKITNKSGPRVYDYDTVRELWPEVRRRLLDQNKIENVIEETGQVEFKDLVGPAARARAGGIRR